MVIGIPFVNEKDCNCEICIRENHKRYNFPTSSTREKEPLELVHIDTCGQMKIQYIGGSLYFLNFIDYYSKKIWIYLITNKSNTFSRFKEFKAEEKTKVESF